MILNSTPLIYITRAGYKRIFREFNFVISKEVYREVVTEGKNKGIADAFVIEELINGGIIKIKKIKNKKFLSFLKKIAADYAMPLHPGEAEVLALAKERDDIAIIDESSAREIGNVLGIKVRGSMYLFVKLFKKKLLSKNQLLDALDEMVKAGYWLSPDDYTKIRNELDGL